MCPVVDAYTSGTATVEVKVSDTVKKVLTVNVTEAGAIDSYTVEGFETKLDKNASNDKTESEFTLSVFPVDENGVKTAGAVNNAKYTIVDKDGKEVVASTATSTKIDAATNANLKAGETYTIAVKVGTLEVFKDTFTVENTSAKPSLVQKESSVVVNDDAKIDFSKLFTVNFEGKEETNYTVTAIEATSDNSAVATTFKPTDAATKNIEFTSSKDGSATVILQSVTLNITGAANNPYEVKLNNVPVNVKVGIVAKAKLKTDAETALSAVNGITISKTSVIADEQAKVDAANTAIQEALDGGYTQSEVEAFTNYSDIATKQEAIDKQVAVNTEAAKITAEGITDLSDNSNVKTQAQALVADGYTVSIESGDADGNSAIAESGVVTRPENSASDVTGDVVFTVTKDGVTQEVTVELTVVKKEA